MRIWVDSVNISAQRTTATMTMVIKTDGFNNTDDYRASMGSTDVRILPPDVRTALLLWLTTGDPAEARPEQPQAPR